jgi:hypothetical protein
MARPGNPTLLASAVLVGLVLIVVGIVLAVGSHPLRGPALIVLGVVAVLAGVLVDRRARRAGAR